MATWPSESTLFNTSITGADANPLMKTWLETNKQLVGAVAPVTLRIGNGSITPTAANILVDTEGGAAADTLSVIATSKMHDGAIILLRSADSPRKVTIQHSTGTGGLATVDAKNITLDTEWPLLACLVGDRWLEIPGARRAYDAASTPVPKGGIISFSGTFGGTDNRFPIPLGGTTPDTRWCLCDGVTTNGFAVPDLRDRMILGASASRPAGSVGGEETHEHSVSGAVGVTTITEAQLTWHKHGVRSSGNSGANSAALLASNNQSGFWVEADSKGSSQGHTHSLTASTGTATNLSPYYALAYIMRCA